VRAVGRPMRGVKVTADLTEVGLARLARVAPRDATALLRAVGRPMRRVAVTADLAVVRVTRLAHVAPRDAAALRAGGPGEARDNLRPDSKGEPANISELLPHTVSAAVQKGVLECSPVEVLSDKHLRHFLDRLRVHSGVP